MFKPQFAPLVEAGSKRQTIRPTPKRMPKVGDHESWREWIGKPYRSEQRELAQVELTEVEPINIAPEVATNLNMHNRQVFYDTDALAKADGFKGWREMSDWFERTHGLPFTGILIRSKTL